jgi:PqqD family protein of HPr-rel-A system
VGQEVIAVKSVEGFLNLKEDESSSKNRSTIRWRINPDCRFYWKRWGEEYILFNAASNQTHYLNSFGADVLRQLQTEPLTSEQLSQHLVNEYGLPFDENISAYVAEILSNMDELGLIEPSNS